MTNLERLNAMKKDFEEVKGRFPERERKDIERILYKEFPDFTLEENEKVLRTKFEASEVLKAKLEASGFKGPGIMDLFVKKVQEDLAHLCPVDKNLYLGPNVEVVTILNGEEKKMKNKGALLDFVENKLEKAKQKEKPKVSFPADGRDSRMAVFEFSRGNKPPEPDKSQDKKPRKPYGLSIN